MAAGTLVSVEEYLATAWRPDRDYVDGELVERNPGEFSHGRLIMLIGGWLAEREARWRIKSVRGSRLQINPSRFRIPDLMVLANDAPDEEIFKAPPLLCIEIVSSNDTLPFTWDRLEDYYSIGVPVCWTIDPFNQIGWLGTPGQLARPADGVLRAGEIAMPLAEVFEWPLEP